MWVVEKYIKYLIGFVLLWFGLIFYRSCGCAKVQGNFMAPSFISEQFVTVYAGKNQPGGAGVVSKDVVWFWFKAPNSREDGYLGRVVALPGDHFALKAGDVLIKNIVLPEEYLKPEDKNHSQNVPDIVVPRDTYIILCDNRKDPAGPDSRRFGPIPVTAVWGKIRK
jgi:signal peptidase I